MFMNINMTDPDRILRVIFAYTDIKKEIPEDILIKYMDKVHDISIRFLCANLMAYMVPPVILLKRLVKSKREYPLFVQTLHNTFFDIRNSDKLKENAKATWKLLNSLVNDADSVKTESFRSFFYKK
jgi:thiaminase